MSTAGGDILVTQKEAGDQPFFVDFDIAAGDTGTKNPVAARTNFTLYVQKITVSPITGAAQNLTFQDNAGTPVKIGVYTGTVGNTTPVVWDFGPHGTALTVSKELDIVISAAGLAARIHFEGYMRQNGTIVVGVSGAGTETPTSQR